MIKIPFFKKREVKKKTLVGEVEAFLNLGRRKRVMALLSVFLLAFVARFAFISLGPFHYDTLNLALASQDTLESLKLQGVGYPLTILCGSIFIFFFRLFGVMDPVFCVNVASVVFGALSCVILFFLAEKLFDFHRAMLSSILLACFAPHVAISTFGTNLTLSICLSLGACYYMLRYTLENQDRHLVFSGIFMGLCAAARFSDALVILPILYLFWSHGKMEYAKLRSCVVFLFIAVITAGIYYLPMVFDEGVSSFTGVVFSHHQLKFLGLSSSMLPVSLGWLIPVLMPHGLFLVVAGFARMAREKRWRPFIFLVIWFLVLELFYGNMMFCGMRCLVIAWIPLVVAQGVFLGTFQGKRFYLALLIVAMSALAAFSAFALVLEFRHRHAPQVDFAEWVADVTPREAVVMAGDEGLFIEYYAGREVLYKPPMKDEAEVTWFFYEQLDSLLEAGEDLYCLSSAFSYDDSGVFKKKLFEHYRLTLIGGRRNEDWHQALLHNEIFDERLYRIEPGHGRHG